MALREQMNGTMNCVPRVVGLAKIDHCGHRWHFREIVENLSPMHRRRRRRPLPSRRASRMTNRLWNPIRQLEPDLLRDIPAPAVRGRASDERNAR